MYELGGVIVLLNCLESFLHNPGAFTAVSWAICSFTREHKGNSDAAMNAHAANVILKGMNALREHAGAQASGSAALFSLAYFDDHKECVAHGDPTIRGVKGLGVWVRRRLCD